MKNKTTTQKDLSQWLALTTVKGVTPKQWLDVLVDNAISLEQLFEGSWQPKADQPADLPEKLVKLIDSADERTIQQSLHWQSMDSSHRIISVFCSSYPETLRQLSSPPLVLFVKGSMQLITQPSIAIVGSRRCTHPGKQIAHQFAGQLAENGWSVVSGLAAGIDAAAHEGALKGPAKTIAVIGTGPDKVYPARNHKLHDKILSHGGVVVSEFWPGTPPRASHFPRRNRIIASMSMGTLVIEAAIKSGTLITANLAIDLGREVFAVPGNIFNSTSEGCHYLIQQGAKLVFKVEDIIEEFSSLPVQLPLRSVEMTEKTQHETLATDELLDSVDFDVTAVDVIAERNKLSVSEVLATLLEYELRGWVAAVPGGYIKLRGKKNVRHPHVSI
ncbi:DNA-processing protein DprA [Alteromonas sp. ASW11-130]|uniref:DNA-processing protein DprA n=1 Tax=Alteromonas sp. ASW11-130 TaxID=3015775 RepID=UPI002241D066|nr:DNA-processing protein DprA [Alteromonas sp. ASW11-130]MCW8093472.1 DNA-processing protein DprA [Alteromonas sp. ASW11-130]